MMTLEREIASIETANINKETMTAMQNASKALKVIHGGLTVDKVDQTMYGNISFSLHRPQSSRGVAVYNQAADILTGKISANNTLLAKRLPKHSLKALLVQA